MSSLIASGIAGSEKRRVEEFQLEGALASRGGSGNRSLSNMSRCTLCFPATFRPSTSGASSKISRNNFTHTFDSVIDKTISE